MSDLLIRADRVYMEIFSLKHVDNILNYQLNNRDYLCRWEPLRDDEFFTKEYWSKEAKINEQEYLDGKAYRFVIYRHNDKKLIGQCNFTNVVRGPFQACFLGYSIDHRVLRNGYMYEALSTLLDYMFSTLRLNRVMSNYMPSNLASANLLEKLNFKIEGRAQRYLKINGKWEDHILTSKLSDVSAV
ncbi:30S ribosomal protein S5 alanine N-acetyltransferase [Paraphotobacterium marinum]|uniref:30S ribosomal protein S5 alanine N-acetyltransferase n=1 Tax=Paraphotobacterium marinum TaxID=1755811 RepID=A0A220VG20_9GAMM|nr:GNAT family N-acetyltransferase [Paraphotobacterium marinum]ASK79315.1 30S ribosomal protein S5 alanine N-acetyltransferase [Paraphotobacterium marinum]